MPRRSRTFITDATTVEDEGVPLIVRMACPSPIAIDHGDPVAHRIQRVGERLTETIHKAGQPAGCIPDTSADPTDVLHGDRLRHSLDPPQSWRGGHTCLLTQIHYEERVFQVSSLTIDSH
jgi:hypothetical protein